MNWHKLCSALVIFVSISLMGCQSGSVIPDTTSLNAPSRMTSIENIVNEPDNYYGQNITVIGSLRGSGIGIFSNSIIDKDGFRIYLNASVKNELDRSGITWYSASGTYEKINLCNCEICVGKSCFIDTPNLPAQYKWSNYLMYPIPPQQCLNENKDDDNFPEYARCKNNQTFMQYYLQATKMKVVNQ